MLVLPTAHCDSYRLSPELFEGGDKMQLWQDFCSASEEEQRRVLLRVNTTPAARAKLVRPLLPHERYDRLDRRVKALLKVSLVRRVAGA